MFQQQEGILPEELQEVRDFIACLLAARIR
jgi:hypothetical protein